MRTAKRPQTHERIVLSTGRKHAVGTWGSLSWQGAWAWHWKDAIDRKFVQKYRPAPSP